MEKVYQNDFKYECKGESNGGTELEFRGMWNVQNAPE